MVFNKNLPYYFAAEYKNDGGMIKVTKKCVHGFALLHELQEANATKLINILVIQKYSDGYYEEAENLKANMKAEKERKQILEQLRRTYRE